MNKNIVLIGLPGCGKTTIGKMLGAKLKIEVCDVDEYIEESQEKSIQDIFQYGEAYFRKIESKAIEEISTKCPLIISTGGGVVENKRNMENLKKKGNILFINRPLENILQDVDTQSRPLLKDKKEKIYAMNRERYPLYQKYCDYEIANDTDLDEVVNQVEKFLREK